MKLQWLYGWLYGWLDQIIVPTWFHREIRLNDTGDDVQRLQILLNRKYRTTLAEDGIYGRNTMELIQRIQFNGELPVTGVCNRRTLNLIASEPENNFSHSGSQIKKLLQFAVMVMPLSIMVIFLWKPHWISRIFHKNGSGIIFFVSCLVWILLVVDKFFGLGTNQIVTESTKYLRDFLYIYNQ